MFEVTKITIHKFIPLKPQN